MPLASAAQPIALLGIPGRVGCAARDAAHVRFTNDLLAAQAVEHFHVSARRGRDDADGKRLYMRKRAAAVGVLSGRQVVDYGSSSVCFPSFGFDLHAAGCACAGNPEIRHRAYDWNSVARGPAATGAVAWRPHTTSVSITAFGDHA